MCVVSVMFLCSEYVCGVVRNCVLDEKREIMHDALGLLLGGGTSQDPRRDPSGSGGRALNESTGSFNLGLTKLPP